MQSLEKIFIVVLVFYPHHSGACLSDEYILSLLDDLRETRPHYALARIWREEILCFGESGDARQTCLTRPLNDQEVMRLNLWAQHPWQRDVHGVIIVK
jgi:hypothetical protein